MDRYAKMAEMVAEEFLAAKRPDDMFGAMFFDLREKAKDLKDKWSQEAGAKLEVAVKSDLTEKGLKVISFGISLGQYRGSKFVTSAKLKVLMKDPEMAEKLAVYMRGKYSPKFKLKEFDPETGEADFNVR